MTLHFCRPVASDCLFFSSYEVIVLDSVDNILLFGNEIKIASWVNKLKTLIEVTDLGIPSHQLGKKFWLSG